jgi:hypothetical protein
MRFWDSDEYRQSSGMRLLHTGPRLSPEESRTIFTEMVRAETRNGALSPLRRRRLIAYAAALQLTPLEASRIVTEISREADEARGIAPPLHYRLVEAAAAPHSWPVWLKITLVLLAAFAVDRLLRAMW